MSLVIIQFDRLPASSLGCYGSFACETPAFDLLAAQAVTFDGCFVSDPSLDLRRCLTADRPVLDLLLDARSPESVDEAASRLLDNVGAAHTMPLWCDVSLGGPRELDPGELACESSSEIDGRLEKHFEGVALADEMLMRCLETVAGCDERIGVVVTSQRGDPLAARTARPGGILPVGEELAHVPLIVALADGPVTRRSDLLGTPAAAALLAGLPYVEQEMQGEYLENWLATVEGRDHLTYGAPPWQAIRTQDWLAVRRCQSDAPTTGEPPDDGAIQLFAKPDDRWEILDLARQYPAVVDELAAKAGWPTGDGG